MALVACRECGQQVSTEAQACPHCGVPDPAPLTGAPSSELSQSPQRSTARRWVLAFSLVVVAVIAVVWGQQSDWGANVGSGAATERGEDYEHTLAELKDEIQSLMEIAHANPDMAKRFTRIVETRIALFGQEHGLSREEQAAILASVTPRLEFRSFGLRTVSGVAVLRGEVTNIWTEPLRNVRVVADFTLLGENALATVSENALIEFSPLMPGQTSAFSVTTRPNPAITGVKIEFLDGLSGEQIPSARKAR